MLDHGSLSLRGGFWGLLHSLPVITDVASTLLVSQL